MHELYIVGAIFAVAAVTLFTRSASFLFLQHDRIGTPITYLGIFSPSMIIMILTIYFFKDTVVFAPPYAIPEMLAGALTVGLHLWKRNTLISIAVPTVFYMVLIQTNIINKLLLLL